jgi:hypothetical protein
LFISLSESAVNKSLSEANPTIYTPSTPYTETNIYNLFSI